MLRGRFSTHCISNSFLKRKADGTRGWDGDSGLGADFSEQPAGRRASQGGRKPRAGRPAPAPGITQPHVSRRASGLVSLLRIWAGDPRVSPLGTVHAAGAQITSGTGATEETGGEFGCWSSEENLRGGWACFEDSRGVRP